MNLVLITRTTENAEGETVQEAVFCGSQAEATKQRVEWVSSGTKRKETTTTAINVPTDKDGLIGFLNLVAKSPTVAAAALRLIES